MECRKCPYFLKNKNKYYGSGKVIVGFCKLRQKDISDHTVGQMHCKDRAVFTPRKEGYNIPEEKSESGTVTF